MTKMYVNRCYGEIVQFSPISRYIPTFRRKNTAFLWQILFPLSYPPGWLVLFSNPRYTYTLKKEAAMHDDHSHFHAGSHHSHSHTHDPEQTRAILNRLSRAIGHLEAVRQMVLEERDCTEVLTQLSAVRSALNNTGVLILKNHLNHCIVEAVQEGDEQALSDLNTAIDRYFK